MGLASSFPAAAVCSVGRSGCGICHDGLMLNFIMSAACVVQLNVCVMNSEGVVAHVVLCSVIRRISVSFYFVVLVNTLSRRAFVIE